MGVVSPSNEEGSRKGTNVKSICVRVQKCRGKLHRGGLVETINYSHEFQFAYLTLVGEPATSMIVVGKWHYHECMRMGIGDGFV